MKQQNIASYLQFPLQVIVFLMHKTFYTPFILKPQPPAATYNIFHELHI